MTENTHDDAYVATLEKKIDKLTQLLKVTTALNTFLLSGKSRLEALLSYLMDSAAEITESDAASVLLWNNQTHELFFAATNNNNDNTNDLIGKPVPLESSVAGTILRERRALMIDDAINDPRVYTKVDEDLAFVTRSLMGVPMLSKNKVIGVLEVVNKRQLPWLEEDRSNLQLLADEAAVAIEVAQMVEQLRKMNEELNEVDKLKSDFIAIASHELRTPLSVILGYASFLQEEDDESVSAHATKVMNSALQLRSIIEDMINLRYLKQKQSELNREPMKLSQLVNDLQYDVLTLADSGGHELEILSEGEGTVSVDRGRIGMALINILNNAISFSDPTGKITIRTYLPKPDEARISITDYGIGIPKDKLETIFEEFYQIEDHMVRHHGGLGIGLSIARALVKAHGGRMWAESDGLGKGATFTLTLPLTEA